MSELGKENRIILGHPNFKNSYMELEVDILKNKITVLKIFVEEEHRGKGLAAWFMEQVLGFAKNCGGIEVIPVCSYAKKYMERSK